MDVENETKRKGSLSYQFQDKTALAIANRMCTVAGADHIVVLKDGQVVQQGTPAELMIEQCGLYLRMAEIQVPGDGCRVKNDMR